MPAKRPKLTPLDRYILGLFHRGWPIERIVGTYHEITRAAVDRALRKAVRPGGRGYA